MEPISRAKEVVELEIAGLRRVCDTLGESFETAIEAIEGRLRQGGKVVVTGVGKNLHIAQKISGTLSSTGTPSVVLDVQQAMHGDLGLLAAHDVMLALSYSGESEELMELLPRVRECGVLLIALTGVPQSSIGTMSDTVVSVAIDREACPFNLAPTVSTTATLAVGDALAMVLLDRRDFTQQDYAHLHPGGAIGRTLLLRIRDFMRTGDRLARVTSGQTVRDAVVAMTRARSGSAGIVDADGVLLGLFTDGDLRRHLFDSENVLKLTVDEVMTCDPVTLGADERAADVFAAYAANEIDDLPVVDEAGHLVGLIDIQQLPKLKIL